MVSIDFHSMENNTMEIRGDHNCLVSHILQNIFFYVPQKKKKETHTALEQLEGEYDDDSISIFGWTIPLSEANCSMCFQGPVNDILCYLCVFSSCLLFKFAPAVGHKQHHQTENVQQTWANQIPYLPGRGWSLSGLGDKLLDLCLFLPATLHLSFLLLCSCALHHEQGCDHGPERTQVKLQNVVSRTERGLREIKNMERMTKRNRKRSRE